MEVTAYVDTFFAIIIDTLIFFYGMSNTIKKLTACISVCVQVFTLLSSVFGSNISKYCVSPVLQAPPGKVVRVLNSWKRLRTPSTWNVLFICRSSILQQALLWSTPAAAWCSIEVIRAPSGFRGLPEQKSFQDLGP